MPDLMLISAPISTKLMSALRGYLAANQLPDPARISFGPDRNVIEIQPEVAAWESPVAVMTSLLMWARGLSGLTAEWWRVQGNADSLHINIHGRLLGGTRIHLYRGIRYASVSEWVNLEPGIREAAYLDELYWLIGELHSRPSAA
jgi:hypothetical protein